MSCYAMYRCLTAFVAIAALIGVVTFFVSLDCGMLVQSLLSSISSRGPLQCIIKCHWLIIEDQSYQVVEEMYYIPYIAVEHFYK